MKKGVFLDTENVSRFRAAVRLAEDTERGRPGMVMSYGPAGYGKTIAALNTYATGGGVYLRAWENWTQHPMLQTLCFEVCGIRPHGSNRCKTTIIEALNAEPKTIYMDEADRLDMGRVEDLRDIHDETGAPMVLIGEEGLPARLAARSRIWDRIPSEYQIKFGQVTQEDVGLFALEAASLTLTPEACRTVHRISRGNFRRVHNAIISLEQMAKAAETGQIDQAMASRLVNGGRK